MLERLLHVLSYLVWVLEAEGAPLNVTVPPGSVVNLELKLMLDDARSPVFGPKGLQKYFPARKINFSDMILILYRGFEYEHLRGKYFYVMWLLDSLIEDIVVIVELDNKPRVNLPLGTKMYHVLSFSRKFYNVSYFGSLNFDGRYIVRPYAQQAF